VSESEELQGLLNGLADGWCERRALRPLSRFLPGYFAMNGLTDGWQALYDALRDVQALERESLTVDELRDVKRAINLVGRMLG
jgi:hypothetical protein